MLRRRFELHQKSAHKFCEIWLEGVTVRGRFGVFGSAGSNYSKVCDSEQAAQKVMAEKILGFEKKGYSEVKDTVTARKESTHEARKEVVPLSVVDVVEVAEPAPFEAVPETRLKSLEVKYFSGASLDRAVKEKFGFSEFRLGQREAIGQLLENQRLLCILPTGHGKSLLFQLPASLLPGVTIVFSPLKALMRDQIQKLNGQFKVPAASLDSDLNFSARSEVEKKLVTGALKILYIAPEQLNRPDVLQLLMNIPISMIGVDEAHCISTWGHDFRPAFREIRNFIKTLLGKNPNLLVLCLTATANKKVADDISKQFALAPGDKAKTLRASANRPNLRLSVQMTDSPERKLAALKRILSQGKAPTVIYCASRKNAEEVADKLKDEGFEAKAFHGAMQKDKRHAIQNQFVKNECEVVVATNSLGMGVDKPDIRRVIHYGHPANLTNYYQEVGRAGRDGQLAECILLFSKEDRRIQDFFLKLKHVDPADVQEILEVIQTLSDGKKETTVGAIEESVSFENKEQVERILVDLIDQGFVVKVAEQRDWTYRLTGKNGSPDLWVYGELDKKGQKELEEMVAYGTQKVGCYMATLRRALGDISVKPCGHCGICKKAVPALRTISSEPKPKLKEKTYDVYEIRKSLPKAYTPWTVQEDKLLMVMHKDGDKIEEIAKRLNRGEGAIHSRLQKFIPNWIIPSRFRPKYQTKEKVYEVSKIRESHPKAYAPWTKEDDSQLKELHKKGVKVQELASRFNRLPGAIRSRLKKFENEQWWSK